MSITDFTGRHIGPRKKDVQAMLKEIGVPSLDALIEQTIPASIRLGKKLNIPEGQNEHDFLSSLRKTAAKNQIFKSYIGLGYHNCIIPGVIQRNVFESPGWYTAYTPYQAEIAQGRLEALLNFQTMILDLTGMEITNASLLDEATAAGEAMHIFYASRTREQEQKGANKLFVSQECFPQTIDVLKTRSAPLNIELVIGDHLAFKPDDSFFGAIIQYPATNGEVYDYTAWVEQLKSKNIPVAVATDLMALALLKSPGEWGAAIVFGNSQRFGVPLGSLQLKKFINAKCLEE